MLWHRLDSHFAQQYADEHPPVPVLEKEGLVLLETHQLPDLQVWVPRPAIEGLPVLLQRQVL